MNVIATNNQKHVPHIFAFAKRIKQSSIVHVSKRVPPGAATTLGDIIVHGSDLLSGEGKDLLINCVILSFIIVILI